MDDLSVLEWARKKFGLPEHVLEQVRRLSNSSSISIEDALLQLGIVSRRQLTDLIPETSTDRSSSDAIPPSILNTVEQPIIPAFKNGPERYVLEDEIARGGMGRIVDALDTNLDRPVALKLLLQHQSQSMAWESRFIQEAQVTGQLQHPSIIPVYDIGCSADGELYFSMKKVEGVTLLEVFKGLRNEDPNMVARFTRSKLLQTFQMICMAVAYAHSRSVIHRDIKPSNIMIGEFGEVFLMDWGLAKILERAPEDGLERVRSHREEQGRMTTRQGEAIGTPGYMSPELALGQLHLVDERSDIYALGAILYEILTLRRPYGGKDVRTIIQRMLKTPVISASQRTPGRDVPEQLDRIASRCLERDIALRYRSVLGLCRELQGFVENHIGARNRHSSLVHRLEPSFDAYWTARQQLDALREKIEEDSRYISPWSRIESRRELWQNQRQLEHLESEVDQLFIGLIQISEKRLSKEGDIRSLISLMGAALKTELVPPHSAARALESERLVKDFKHWPNLERGIGRLAIRVDRPNVIVELAITEEVDGISQVTAWRNHGVAPSVIERLPPGSYVLRLTDQRLTYTAPILMPRVGDVTLDIEMSRLTNLPDGFCPILKASAVIGGDSNAFWPQGRTHINIEDFAIGRVPITFGQYLSFLNALSQTDLDEALNRCPRTESTRLVACLDGHFSFPKESPFQHKWDDNWPVFGISWDDATAYCAWRSHHDQQPYRLPTANEWEVAARGADERIYPWGNIWEPTFCNNALENPGAPRLTPIGSHPTDMSPYGVMDLAGGVAEWTDERINDPDVGSMIAICKGGSWTRTDRDARLASRHPMFPDAVSRRVGFRLALTLT